MSSTGSVEAASAMAASPTASLAAGERDRKARPAQSTSARRSVAWLINGERLVVLGWPRAILLQVAHPLVAAGVFDHSSFRDGGLAGLSRLGRTIAAMRRLTFGGEREHAATIARIRAIHRRVNGHLKQPVGGFTEGTSYTAEDPALVLWVHITLVDSLVRVYELLVAALREDQRDQFCADAAQVAIELGAHEAEVPRSWSRVQDQLASTLASGQLAIGRDGAVIGQAVLSPKLPMLAHLGALGMLSFALRATRTVTVGLLPASVRGLYGLSWSDRDERHLNRIARLLRAIRWLTPGSILRWRDAR